MCYTFVICILNILSLINLKQTLVHIKKMKKRYFILIIFCVLIIIYCESELGRNTAQCLKLFFFFFYKNTLSTKTEWLFFLYFHEIWFLAGLKTARFYDVKENIIKGNHIFLRNLLEKYAASPSEE